MVGWLKAAWNIRALFQDSLGASPLPSPAERLPDPASLSNIVRRKAPVALLAMSAALTLLSPVAASAADGDGCNYLRNNPAFYDNANYNVSSTGPTVIINQAPFGPQTGITNFAAGTVVYYEYAVSSSAVNARLNRAPLAGVATVFVDTNTSGSGSITLPVAQRSMAASAYVPGAGSGTVTWTIYCGVSATQAVASATGSVGTAISFTPVTAAYGRGTYSYALSGGTLPAGLSFDTGTGAVTGTPTAALAATTFTVTVTASQQATGSASRNFQLTVDQPAPVASSFTAAAVPYNTGSASATMISVAGNATNSPNSYAVGSATTAQGGSVSIDASGQASYTPPSGFRGNDSFTYTATNAGGTSSPATVTAPVSNPVLVTSLTGSGAQSVPLSGVQIDVSGGRAPYSCGGVISGSIPAGVTINPNCSITGTPATGGAFNFRVGVTDSTLGTGPFTQASSTLALAVTARPTLTSLSDNTADAAGSTTDGGGASTLTLTGADFTNATSASFGGATFSAGAFTIVSDSAISLTVPDAAAAGVSGVGGVVNVTVSSSAGASSAQPFTYVLTPTVNAITTPTSDNTPAITGTAVPGATINLTLAGPSPFSTSGVTANGSGDWTFTPTQRNDGAYTAQVTQTVSTVTSGASNQIAFDIDATPPAPPTVASPTEGQNTGSSVSLSGATEAISTVEIQIDSGPFMSATVTGANWTFSATGLSVGPHTATVRAKDSLDNTSTSTVRSFTVAAAPTIGSLSPAGGLTAGGTTVTLSGGALAGATLTVDGSTVSTSGNTGSSLTFVTPAHAAGAAPVVVTTPGGSASTSYTYIAMIQVSPAAGALPGGTATTGYSQTFTASGGTGPYTFSTTGSPPPGLAMSAGGVLSGTPTDSGTFNFNVAVSDSSAAIAGSAFMASQSYSITIIKAGQTITFPGLSNESLSASPLTLSGGSAATASSGLAVTYSSATTSVCGVSGAAVTLLVTGTCTINADQAGDASYDAAPQVQQSFSVTPAHLTLSTGGASGTQVGAGYSQANTASGGVAPYTYTLEAGAFVPGTTLSSSTGLVSGTPTIAGTFSYIVKVTDSQGAPVSASSSITTTTIAKGDQTANFTSTAPGGASVGGTAYVVTATATSGLGAVFSLDGASTGCDLSGNSVTFSSTGTCRINANQPGDSNWNASPQVQQSFTIGAAGTISASVDFAPTTVDVGDSGTVTITFTNPNASSSPAFNALLTSPSLVTRGGGAPGGTCSIGSTSAPTATTVQFGAIVVAPGSCTITLDYAGAVAGSTSGFTLGAFTPSGYPTTSATGGNAFAVAPKVTGVSPSSGPVSQVVTVSGDGFSTTPGDNTVRFGAVAGNVTAASKTSLTVTAPATGSGPTTVTVTVNGQTSSTSAIFTFIDKPVVADKSGVAVPFNSPGTAIDLSASISGGPHSSIAIGAAPAHGVTSTAGDVVTYIPTTGYAGPDSFTYMATGAGGTSNVATVSLTVSQGAQTITFGSTPPSPALVGGAYSLAATASSGLAVTFTIDPSSSAVCSLAGAAVSFTLPGTCTINADQAGDASFTAAPRVQQTVTIGQASQTITFTSTPPSPAPIGGAYSLSATASSGLPVTFTIDPSASAACSLSGGAVTFTGVGACLINADQPGDVRFTAAPRVQQSMAVSQASQAIAFTSTPPSPATVGGTYAPAATASSGLPVAFAVDAASSATCSLSGGVVTFTGAGVCTLNADQAGDASFTAAPRVQQTVAIGQASQTITFTSTAPSPAAVGATYALAATASSGLPVAFTLDASSSATCSLSGSVVTFTAAGVCTLNADQAGDANFTAAPRAQQAMTVTQTAQAITFTSTAPSSPQTGTRYTPTATASSGLTVNFSITPASAGICSLSSGVVSFSAAGTCVINADQPGDSVFSAAPQAQQSIAVVLPPPPVADSTDTAVSVRGDAGVTASIDLSAMVTGDYTSIVIDRQPAHGTVVLTGAAPAAAANFRAQAAALAGPTIRAVYTPAANYSGPDSFTFRAVGPGGASSPATVLIQVIAAVPTAAPRTINVLAGRKVTVDLTGGAVGGPFTGGAVVSTTPADAADVRLVEGGTATNRTYSLDFTARTNTAQTVTVLYTLSNAGGTSAPLTLTFQVAARPDPSADPEVRGLESAATGAARRATGTQIRNFGRRMEQLHDGRCAPGMGVSLSSGLSMMGDDPTRPGRGGPMDRGPDGMLAPTANAASANGAASNGARKAAGAGGQGASDGCDDGSGVRDQGHIEPWINGVVTIGRRDASTGENRFDISTSGLAAGADVVLAPGVTLGLGGGFGRDESDVGDKGSQVQASSWVAGAYGSFRPVRNGFVDVLAGVGGIDFDLTRYVTATGGFATAQRNADLLFGSVRAGVDRNDGPLRWSLFGGVEASRTNFDSYVEVGPESFSLAYDARKMKSVTGLVGGRFEYSVLSGRTLLTPRGRFEYRYDFERAEGQRVRFSDWLSGPSYLIDADGWSRSGVTVELGVGAVLPTGWRMGADVTSDLSGDSRLIGLRLEISRGF